MQQIETLTSKRKHLSMMQRADYKFLVIALVVAAIIGIVAISNDSFWIDEGGTGYTTMQPTISAWWNSMLWERNSNMQLPLYLLVLWAWGQCFGLGEWTLRMFNLPCFLLIVLATWLAFRHDRRIFVFSFLFLSSSAYVWFYLDQARPYAFLLAASMFLFGAVYQFWRTQEWSLGWIWWFTCASLVVAATSIIGYEWVGFSIITIWYVGGRNLPSRFVREFPTAFITLVVGLTTIGTYYIWSLRFGADVPKFGRNGFIMDVLFVLYEYLGFSGLGPNRNELRAQPFAALVKHSIPLAILALLLVGLLLCGRAAFRSQRPRAAVFYALLLLPEAVTFLTGEMRNVRVLPRHLTPLAPLLVFVMACLLARCWQRNMATRSVAAGFLMISMLSALEIRFASRHLRDDYRSAAAIAKREIGHGTPVLWAADAQTAMYYRLIRTEDWNTGGSAMLLLNERGLMRLPKNNSIVLYSKPDLYDKDRTIHSFLLENNFSLREQFEAFEVWSSPSSKASITRTPKLAFQ